VTWNATIITQQFLKTVLQGKQRAAQLKPETTEKEETVLEKPAKDVFVGNKKTHKLFCVHQSSSSRSIFSDMGVVPLGTEPTADAPSDPGCVAAAFLARRLTGLATIWRASARGSRRCERASLLEASRRDAALGRTTSSPPAERSEPV